MLRPLLVLALLGALCGTLLYVVHAWTGPAIASNHAQARQAIFTQMLPADTDLSALTLGTRAGDCDNWIAASATTPGYGGPMEFAYVVDPGARSISLRNVRHTETPGFGDFITSGWLAEQDGATLADWQDLDTITGATITFEALRNLSLQVLTETLGGCDAV